MTIRESKLSAAHGVLSWLHAQWAVNLRSALEYRVSFLVQSLAMMVNNFIFFAFWGVFFARFEQVDGWDLRAIALLYGVCASGFGLGVILWGGYQDLARQIAEGGLDAWLLRPKPLFLQAMSGRMRISGFGDIASGVILLMASGYGTVQGCLTFVLMSLVGATVFVTFAALVSCLAFFVGHAGSTAGTAMNTLVTLSCYPPGLFDGAARVIVHVVVPAGLMSYIPASLVRHWDIQSLGLLLLGVAALMSFTTVAWGLGLRRYESGNMTQSVQR